MPFSMAAPIMPSIIIWMYTGITWITFSVDTGNIGFHLPIIILFPLINGIAQVETKLNQYINVFILLFFLLLQ